MHSLLRTAAWLVLAGSCSAPASAQVTASLSPTTLAYGDVTVTTDSAPQLVTLRNTSASASFNVTALTPAFRYREVAGGTCPARPFPLAPGASCTFAIVFNPNSTGSFTGALSVSTSPAATFTPTSVALGGNGVPVPLTLSPTTLAFGDIEINATSTARLVTVRNVDAAATATITAISPGFRYTLVPGGSCAAMPFTLAPQQQCTFAIVFSPNSQGSFGASLSVSATPSSTFTPASIALGGTGVPIPVTLSPATLAFGDVSIGTTSASREFSIANASAMGVAVTIGSVSLGFRYAEAAGSTCPPRPFSLAAGASCRIAVEFSPNSAGNFSGTASIGTTPSTVQTPTSVTLSGTGTALPASLTPTNLAFGNVTVATTSAARSFTIGNEDPVGSFNVTSISVPFRYAIAATGTCATPPFALAPGERCRVDLVFSPNSLGNFSGTVSIGTTPLTNFAPTSIAVLGTGTAVPALYEPQTLAFGDVLVGATSAPRSLSLANADPAASLTVTQLSFGFRYRRSEGGSCGDLPFTLAPGTACSLQVVFEPNSLGNFSGTLSAATTPASDFEPASVLLGGRGAEAQVFRDGFE